MTKVFSVKVYLEILLAKCVWPSLRELMAVWIDLIINMSDHWEKKKWNQLRILTCPAGFYYCNFYIPVPDFTWPQASGYRNLWKTVLSGERPARLHPVLHQVNQPHTFIIFTVKPKKSDSVNICQLWKYRHGIEEKEQELIFGTVIPPSKAKYLYDQWFKIYFMMVKSGTWRVNVQVHNVE
jgi:hypothetical protein